MLLTVVVMSAYESIYNKMMSPLENSATENEFESAPKFDPARHMAPPVAHELNNILTIVQGYADRLLLRHSQDQTLAPHIKLISEAAKRAAIVVRNATPPGAARMMRPASKPQPSPTLV